MIADGTTPIPVQGNGPRVLGGLDITLCLLEFPPIVSAAQLRPVGCVEMVAYTAIPISVERHGACGGNDHIIGGPHFCLKPALSVADAKEPRLAPTTTPAVLADPAAFGVVIADDTDAMAAHELTRVVGVNPTHVGVE